MKNRSIQGLRGWAILLIIVEHIGAVLPGCILPATGDKGVEFFF